jgi:hypothetical protein
LALLVGAGCLCAGCSSAPAALPDAGRAADPEPEATRRSSVLRYFANRGRDFVDMFGLRFSVGEGFVINPQFTKFLMFGQEVYDVAKVGFYGRNGGAWHEESTGGGVLFLYDNASFERDPYWGTVTPVAGETHTNIRGFRSYRGERDIGDVGVTLHFLVGLGAEIRLTEVADFVVGLFGVDLAGDDP